VTMDRAPPCGPEFRISACRSLGRRHHTIGRRKLTMSRPSARPGFDLGTALITALQRWLDHSRLYTSPKPHSAAPTLGFRFVAESKSLHVSC